jgi:hypothetical protein
VLSALEQRWRVGLQHNNSLAANAGSFNHYLMQQRATDRSPERAPAGTTESPRRLGWPAVLALNFLPGVATVALVGVLHPAIESLRWPPVVAYTCAIGLVTLGELAVLARQAQRLSGTWDPRRAVALTARLPFRAAVIPIVGFILVAAGLAALLDPVAATISRKEGAPRMTKVTPFLMFNDQLDAAIELYTTTFPDSEDAGASPATARMVRSSPPSSSLVVKSSWATTVAHVLFVLGRRLALRRLRGPGRSRQVLGQTARRRRDADRMRLDQRPFGLSWQIVPRRFMELIRDQDAGK